MKSKPKDVSGWAALGSWTAGWALLTYSISRLLPWDPVAIWAGSAGLFLLAYGGLLPLALTFWFGVRTLTDESKRRSR